jgi:hypothetical protein
MCTFFLKVPGQYSSLMTFSKKVHSSTFVYEVPSKVMDVKHINQTFDLLSYASILVRLHKKGRYFAGACPMCGGNDRFTIKQTPGGYAWICRKCKPDKYHSALDFLMAYHNENFKDALKRSKGDIPVYRHIIGKAQTGDLASPVYTLPDSAWQAQAWKQVDQANDRLMSDEGIRGREYLASRGLHRGSMYMHLLGFAIISRRAAIVIPWLDVGNIITAVKYRFIDDSARTEKGKRFLMMAGSHPYLFSLQHVLENDESLLFVEGELNAISILQIHPSGVSVVSAGSDSSGNSTLLQALARRYRCVVVWTDEHDKACSMRARMVRPEAHILKSPVIDGVKYDANQLLQAGFLMDFISRELSTECRGIPSSAAMPTEQGARVGD